MVKLCFVFSRSYMCVLLIFACNSPVSNAYCLNPEKVKIEKEITQFFKQSKRSKNQLNPIFEDLLTDLKRKSRVPIMLPSNIGNKGESATVYANIESVDLNKYQIILGFLPDCDGGNACRWGTVSGEKNTQVKRGLGKQVSLSNGVTGYFIDAKCGAVCSDSKIIWFYGQYKYTIGIKAGKEDLLVAVANSAISNGPFE